LETCLLETSNTQIGPRLNRIGILIEEVQIQDMMMEVVLVESNTRTMPYIVIRGQMWHDGGTTITMAKYFLFIPVLEFRGQV
jgi:hypothetical protein